MRIIKIFNADSVTIWSNELMKGSTLWVFLNGMLFWLRSTVLVKVFIAEIPVVNVDWVKGGFIYTFLFAVELTSLLDYKFL